MRQIVGLSEDGNTITLKKFEGEFDLVQVDSTEDRGIGMFIDLETTGLDTNTAKIIDLGYVLFEYIKDTGQVVKILNRFSQLQDPEEPLSEDVKRITGYADEDLVGKSVDFSLVEADFEKANIILAHNAGYDRKLMDRYLQLSNEKVWGCSVDQVNWRSKGHGTRSLEYLCKDHGFFFKGHTALADVEASLHLVSHVDPDTGKPYLNEILLNARTPCKWVVAKNSRYEIKDELKRRGYRWDARKKVWKIKVPRDSIVEEEFLSDHPLGGNPVTHEIPLEDSFK